ncbi:MAG: hypothetical protein KBT75_03520 [Oleispira antarctica]|nr:hypothetical protein [Oleispira antarctica]MBQ0791237.1 hypothetical protein [Oleispira antarctica]
MSKIKNTMDVMRAFFCFALLFLYNSSVYCENKIDAGFSALGSSEPVAIDDMVNGWDGNYQQGELAFADITWDIGFSKTIELEGDDLGRIRISRGHRIYYFLKFDKETADFYRAQEQKTEFEGNKTLDLEVKHFESPSVALSYFSPQLMLPFYDLKSSFKLGVNLYRPGHMQFGEIKGVAYGPGTSSFSANIDYRYDQFKLPWLEDEKAFDTEKGQGYSVDLGFVLEQESWLLDLSAKDAFAQFSWDASGVTVACLQTDAGEGAVCENNGGNGRSDVKSVSETIPVSIVGVLKHKGYDLSLHTFQHDIYQRLGIEKGLKTALGRLGFFLYYPRLAGLSWQTSIFNIQLGADTLKFSQARNIQLNMGVNWRW